MGGKRKTYNNIQINSNKKIKDSNTNKVLVLSKGVQKMDTNVQKHELNTSFIEKGGKNELYFEKGSENLLKNNFTEKGNKKSLKGRGKGGKNELNSEKSCKNLEKNNGDEFKNSFTEKGSEKKVKNRGKGGKSELNSEKDGKNELKGGKSEFNSENGSKNWVKKSFTDKGGENELKGDKNELNSEKSGENLLNLEKGSEDLLKKSVNGGSESYLSGTRFDTCSVSSLSLKGIKDAGYEKMTMVQEATLPLILKGKDVLAKAKTGTGKTVAFMLPSVEVIAKLPPAASRDHNRFPIYVLVVCPTRELASQAATEADKLLKYHPSIGVQVVIGGTNLGTEQKRLKTTPCPILVATPGRLLDHIQNTAGFATRVKGVKVLVLDEADQLLDMGFRKDIEKVVAAVPKQRQTLLFSATVSAQVRQICHVALKADYEFVDIVGESTEQTHAQVRQTHLIAPLDKQYSLLYAMLRDHVADDADYKVLVFCTTAMITRLVAGLLGQLKLNVREIHSRKSQSYRTRVSDEFRKSKRLILVTSDVSARGVDYPDVTLVIQIGLPSGKEQYIHRLGRTGRKGKEGLGILLISPWEEFFLSSIRDLPISEAQMPLVDPETRKKVDQALSNVNEEDKEAAYQSWLGFYSMNSVGRNRTRLVELSNEFSRSLGLRTPPAIDKRVLGKMGLKNVPGLRSK